MKAAGMLLVAAALLLLGCTTTGGGPAGTVSPTAAPAVTATEAPSATETGGQLKEFSMTAMQFAFDPATITVKKGDRVRITVTSADVAHGIALPDFGVDSRVEPGRPTVVEFTADKAGTFTFFCNVMCGAGHRDMTGKLVVEP